MVNIKVGAGAFGSGSGASSLYGSQMSDTFIKGYASM
jgi:hypothetical protein